MPTNPETCDHYSDGAYCHTPTTHRYLTGWRCPQHTPAALAGNPETTPDPAATLAGLRPGQNLFNTANETIVDARAKASGKRRSTPEDFRAAQAATGARP